MSILLRRPALACCAALLGAAFSLPASAQEPGALRFAPGFPIPFAARIRQVWSLAPAPVRAVPIIVVPGAGGTDADAVTWTRHPRYGIPAIGLSRRSLGDFMHELGHVAHSQALPGAAVEDWLRSRGLRADAPQWQQRPVWEAFAETFRRAYHRPSRRTLKQPAVQRVRSYFTP